MEICSKRTKNFKTIIKGDEKIKCISAASIIAKTYRDLLMIKLSEKFKIMLGKEILVMELKLIWKV